ncbi:MAG: hypothetical protein WCD31_09785 [Gillisia sp.]
MINLKRHTSIALLYFLLVSLMGTFLRFFYVFPVPANYTFVLHTHSHTALLGWVYIGFTTLIYKIFLAPSKKETLYKRIFLFTNICIVGMLVTFPVQGYALFSIIFSTLFLFASYWFSWFSCKYVSPKLKKRFSWKLIKAGLFYLVFSSLGPWAVGGIMATLGKGSIWYKLAIYFYLHFQYNAWFIFAILGVLFYILEEAGLSFPQKNLNSFFLFLNAGVILSLFLSGLWVQPPLIFYLLGAAGAIFQILAFYRLFLLLRDQPVLSCFSTRAGNLLKIAGILILGKISMQLLTAFPFFADLAFSHSDLVIGYLHWTFLGIISICLLSFLHHFKLLQFPKFFFPIYFFGFVFSEILIFYKGASLWLGLPFIDHYFVILAVVSCTFPIAIGWLFIRNFDLKNSVFAPGR